MGLRRAIAAALAGGAIFSGCATTRRESRPAPAVPVPPPAAAAAPTSGYPWAFIARNFAHEGVLYARPHEALAGAKVPFRVPEDLDRACCSDGVVRPIALASVVETTGRKPGYKFRPVTPVALPGDHCVVASARFFELHPPAKLAASDRAALQAEMAKLTLHADFEGEPLADPVPPQIAFTYRAKTGVAGFLLFSVAGETCTGMRVYEGRNGKFAVAFRDVACGG